LEVGITYNRMLCNDLTGPARFRLNMPEVALELQWVWQPWSTWTNSLLHKCNWCHVIDTVVQLYMTVDLGSRLKSMSVRSWRWTSLRLPRNPRISARVLLKRANLSFVLMYVMTDAYGSLRFSAIFSASVLLTLLHSGAIPPVVVKTRGSNEDFSMSITLWLCLSCGGLMM